MFVFNSFPRRRESVSCVSLSNSFVLGILVESDKVEHLSHPAPYPVSIKFLKFLGVQVSGGVRTNLLFLEKLMTGEQDLPNDVTIPPVISAKGFYTDVIKTIELRIPII